MLLLINITLDQGKINHQLPESCHVRPPGRPEKAEKQCGLIKNMRLIQSNGLSAATEIHPLCAIVEYKCFGLNLPSPERQKTNLGWYRLTTAFKDKGTW